jgi:hypothetical protein
MARLEVPVTTTQDTTASIARHFSMLTVGRPLFGGFSFGVWRRSSAWLEVLVWRLFFLCPPEIHADTCILEVEPEGQFVTYGVGVPLLAMRDPRKAEGRVPV